MGEERERHEQFIVFWSTGITVGSASKMTTKLVQNTATKRTADGTRISLSLRLLLTSEMQ